MSYCAYGHGSLVLRVDSQAVNDLRTSMCAYYDKLYHEVQESVGESSQKESVYTKYQAEKQMLEDSAPSEWVRRELREAGFSDIYIEKTDDPQRLYIEASFDSKYYEDGIMAVLELLSPQTVEGEFAFRGEDDDLWRLLFTSTGWVDQSGQIVYTDLSTGAMTT